MTLCSVSGISGSGRRKGRGSPGTSACHSRLVKSGSMPMRISRKASCAVSGYTSKSTCLKASRTPVRKPLCASCREVIARATCWQPGTFGVLDMAASRSCTAALRRESESTAGRVHRTSRHVSTEQYFCKALPQFSSNSPMCRPRFSAVRRDGSRSSLTRVLLLSGSYSKTTWSRCPGLESVDCSFSVRPDTMVVYSSTPTCFNEPSSRRTVIRLPSSATSASLSTVSRRQYELTGPPKASDRDRTPRSIPFIMVSNIMNPV